METAAEEPKQDSTENAQAVPSSVDPAATTESAAPNPTPIPKPAPTPTTAPAPTPTTAPAPTPTTAPAPKPAKPTKATTSAPTPTPTSSNPPTLPDPPKKSKREDRNRKEDENVKLFVKAINSAPTLEEKIRIATEKYSQLVDDNKKMQFYIKQLDKRDKLASKERDQLQLEYNKTVLVKSKLENLCRELQKQNKTIKEESLVKVREEEERRRETQGKFQSTLAEITALLHQNNEKNAKLRDDNIAMTEKFKSVVSQYQGREQQVERIAKQMSLEQQLADAKFMKASLEHQAEKERMLAEMEQLTAAVQQHRARVMELQSTETGLRGQLAVYTDKYDEFQNALVKSNKVFGGFKDEMEKMSKKIKKLEKESLSWKKRWETSQTALLDMCGERQASEERGAGVARQLHNMQSLCRTLQAERTVLLSTLKEHSIERPPLPAPVPAPPPPPPAHPASNAKVDAMAANCAQLRQSLAHLQSQLNVLTTKQQEQPAEPPKPEKTKKSKSKKSKKQEVQKESESDSNAKESANESASEEKAAADLAASTSIQAEDKTVEKAETDKIKAAIDKTDEDQTAEDTITDVKVIDEFINAFNNCNVNLSNEEEINIKADPDENLTKESLAKDNATESTDPASVASEISNDQSPINEAKILENVEGITNGVRVVLVTDRLGDDAKVVEFSNGSIFEEVTEETASRPKIIELADDAVLPATPKMNVAKEVKDVANTEIKEKATSA